MCVRGPRQHGQLRAGDQLFHQRPVLDGHEVVVADDHEHRRGYPGQLRVAPALQVGGVLRLRGHELGEVPGMWG
jgi:hypothetical protein